MPRGKSVSVVLDVAVRAQFEPELVAQSIEALVADVHGATAIRAAHPAEVEHARGDRRAERAGQMVALLAPVHAVADERPARRQPVEVDAERLQLADAGGGEAVVVI